jgi:hypothetical protein
MDSIRVSEAPDPGSIPGEATSFFHNTFLVSVLSFQFDERSKKGISFTTNSLNQITFINAIFLSRTEHDR